MDNPTDSVKLTKPMLITLSGSPGSGKSTAAKKVTELIGGTRIYVGEIRRNMAQSRGMTLQQFNEYALTDPSTDVEVDKQVAAQARKTYAKGQTVLVEGRTHFHHLPESLKLYIFCTPEVGGTRIHKQLEQDKTRNEPLGTLEETISRVIKREEQDAQRFLKYFNIDHRVKENYDHVVDSTHITSNQVIAEVMKIIYQEQAKKASICSR